MTLPRPRSLLLLASAACLAVALSGCGRRGATELPPDVQARGAALQKLNAETPKPRAKVGVGDEAQADERLPIPGTSGNRPPQQYPFFLDPLL